MHIKKNKTKVIWYFCFGDNLFIYCLHYENMKIKDATTNHKYN